MSDAGAGAVHLLRVLHIVTGVFWAGTVFFVARFLLPTMRAVGPAGGPVMSHLTQVRRLPMALTIAAWIAIISGLLLVWRNSLGFSPAWFHSGAGLTFTIGGIFALAAAVLGVVVNAPVAKQLGTIAKAIQANGGLPSSEQTAKMRQLQGQLNTATQAAAVLLLLATLAMATARYVP
jgi:hypothetical protein